MISTDITVRPIVWLTAILILIPGLIWTYLISHSETVYVTKDQGYSQQAKKNPFLAAEFFLENQEIQVELTRNYNIFDSEIPVNHSLIITNSRKTLSESRLQVIKSYVKQGGHLILAAVENFEDDTGSSGAPILDEIGARLYRNYGDINTLTPDEWDALDDIEKDRFYDSSSKTKIKFKNYSQETSIIFPNFHYLLDASGDAVFNAGTDSSRHVLQYNYGEGLITVLSSTYIWSNKKLNAEDHAMFLYQLTEDSEKVWIVYNPQYESFIELLWKHGHHIILNALLLLLVIIWFYQIKTGPIFPIFSFDSRKLMQHILAASEFKWRYGNKSQLLTDTREDVERRLKRSHPLLKSQDKAEQLSYMHKLTNIDTNDLEKAFFSEPNNPIEFTNQIQTLQKVRHLLHGNTL
ncbi:DUF4350 domain-containing protein [Pleionea sediminis]|uniref:DUF4350 domain-containing protein n=1 Tax=Pleionea sediminis TaxID=2569479 RepID=UPI001186E0C9|nr:DUF4350 domain-containing protein [Pleionea sediminis]